MVPLEKDCSWFYIDVFCNLVSINNDVVLGSFSVCVLVGASSHV